MTKPSKEEEEYFAREEWEKRRRLAADAADRLAGEEKDKLKELHWMRCPKCGHELLTVTLHAVEVDTCASCGGMWLDAGELDQLMEHDDRGLLMKVVSFFR